MRSIRVSYYRGSQSGERLGVVFAPGELATLGDGDLRSMDEVQF